jgi:NADH-quinone oxidoreductase subunit D
MKTTKLYLGPQHPGITGNMMIELDVEGNKIVKAKTHVGYLHRGFEKLMERRTYIQSFPIVCRICVPEPDVNENNYARAVEKLSGLEVPERAKWIRTMVLEMARLQSYLLWMGGQSGSMGLYTMPQWTVGDRDYLLDRFEELTGGRVYHMYVWPGGVRKDLPPGFKTRMLDLMDYLEIRMKDYTKLMFENAIFKKRAIGTGIIPRDKALKWGVVGPVLRGTGIKHDVRIDEPYEIYDKLEFEVPTYEGGDIYSRALVRKFEFAQSISIIREIMDKIPEGPIYNRIPNPFKWKIPKGYTYVKLESSRGEFGYFMASDGSEKLRRVNVRGPAYVHGISLLEKILPGARLGDVSTILNSLGVCPPEMER